MALIEFKNVNKYYGCLLYTSAPSFVSMVFVIRPH